MNEVFIDYNDWIAFEYSSTVFLCNTGTDTTQQVFSSPFTLEQNKIHLLMFKKFRHLQRDHTMHKWKSSCCDFECSFVF